ncbi:NUDIX hydrolase domain-like [Plasmopara halstedii]|uniref:NUDIX hydrolase domain-like n=1 Tax=Plasmopara halstedii TaxID=4781 RepID=A0A0P1A8I4_PLAHL|nr:NUDIX hydrolase domain-like [Plasmopara halstedii]CEG36871.1 NUDIX hydrolase domain-like [Plasmopara halstedii]|eukprot:XP_024573240.1 NUDIX hydrolase domain-like [Plasmopara halstedii]
MSFSVHSFKTQLAVDQLTICLSKHFNRLTHPDPLIEQQKTQHWNDLKHQAPGLFNASKFRLQTLSEDQFSSSLRMEWGLTDYASYLGTCCSKLCPQLLQDETTDAQVVLIKRSNKVGLYQNLYDTPGGHPEPMNIELTEEVLQKLEDQGNKLKRMQFEDAAKQEFYQSIANEVYEEVNLSLQQQEPPMLMGVVLQTDACTPSFAFYIKAQCSAAELIEMYRAGPSDKFESVDLKLLSADSLLAERSTLLHGLELTPSAEGTLQLWKQHTLQFN